MDKLYEVQREVLAMMITSAERAERNRDNVESWHVWDASADTLQTVWKIIEVYRK